MALVMEGNDQPRRCDEADSVRTRDGLVSSAVRGNRVGSVSRFRLLSRLTVAWLYRTGGPRSCMYLLQLWRLTFSASSGCSAEWLGLGMQ